MKHKSFYILLLSVIMLILLLSSLLSSFAVEESWLTAKVENLENDQFTIGTISGITLFKKGEDEINLSSDERIALLDNINDIEIDSPESGLQKLDVNMQKYIKNRISDMLDVNGENERKNNIDKFVLFTYELSYNGNNKSSAEANVRFYLKGDIINAVRIKNQDVICYSSAFYLNGNNPVKMARIWTEDNSAFYYPWSIKNGDRVKFIYALYFPEFPENMNSLENFSSLDLKVETTFAQNNSTILKWNTMFCGNVAVPFNQSKVFKPIYLEYIANPELYDLEGADTEEAEDAGNEEQGDGQGISEPPSEAPTEPPADFGPQAPNVPSGDGESGASENAPSGPNEPSVPSTDEQTSSTEGNVDNETSSDSNEAPASGTGSSSEPGGSSGSGESSSSNSSGESSGSGSSASTE